MARPRTHWSGATQASNPLPEADSRPPPLCRGLRRCQARSNAHRLLVPRASPRGLRVLVPHIREQRQTGSSPCLLQRLRATETRSEQNHHGRQGGKRAPDLLEKVKTVPLLSGLVTTGLAGRENPCL